MLTIRDRFKNSWNAFLGRSPTSRSIYYGGSSRRPDRTPLSLNSMRSTLNTVFNRLAVDISSLSVRHARINDNGKFVEIIKSDLNEALTTSANLDQTGRALLEDIAMSLFDEGCVAIIPTDTDVDPDTTDSYKIYTLRTAKILQWYPESIIVEVYCESSGKKEQIEVSKTYTAIIENPFYSIMNEPNSTVQRLNRVLNQLDRSNEVTTSDKLDLIVQLPYTIKSDAKRVQAEEKRKDIEAQLTGSKYGVAYIDGTEKVIQLNRSLENNLWAQAQDLTVQLYNQLGLTQSIFDGTADEQTLQNYYSRTIEPIISAIVEEMTRKWISKTARTQGQAIVFYRDPFKLIPVSQFAEIADKMTRNEIMSKNEIRSTMGLKPSDDPKADMLWNSNISHPESENLAVANEETVDVEKIVDELTNKQKS